MKHEELYGKTIRESFAEFHRANPGVFKRFQDLAISAIGRGKIKLSATLIIERIRWDFFMSTDEDDFKINNSYRPYYVRLFESMHPKYKGYFKTRKLRNEQPGPYMEMDPLSGQITFL